MIIKKFVSPLCLAGSLACSLACNEGLAAPNSIDLFPWNSDPAWALRIVRQPPSPSPTDLDGPHASWRDPQAVLSPSWKTDRIARIELDPRGDKRRGEDFRIFRLDLSQGEGIFGADLLELVRPAPAKTYELLMRDQLSSGQGIGAHYREYLGHLVDSGIATLAISRIIDHEAIKNRVSPLPSDLVVHYVKHSIFIQNALDRGLWTGASPGHDVLYAWLKDTVGGKPVRFNIDWTFVQGLELERRQLCESRKEIEYPEVSITFLRLPETASEFAQELRRQLGPMHRKAVRKIMWSALLKKRFPALSDPVRSNQVSTRDLERAYENLKDQAFRIQPVDASVTELVISGPRAAEFRNRYVQLLEERSAQLAQGAGNAGRLRETVPSEILGRVRSELASDIASGRVTVSSRQKEIRYNGVDDLSACLPKRVAEKPFTSKNHCEGYAPVEEPRKRCEAAAAIECQQRMAALNPVFASAAAFPKVEHVDCANSIRIMLLNKVVKREPDYLEIGDRRVDTLLRLKLLSTRQNAYSRELAYELLRKPNGASRVIWENQTCTEPAWPCGATDARRFVELLFRETLFPGMTLGADGPGRPIPDTLGRPALQDRVLDIDGSLFRRALELEN